MSTAQATALLPLMIVGGTSVVVMLEIAVWRNRTLTAWTTYCGLVVAGASAFLVWPVIPQEPTPLLVIDGYAVFYQVLLIVLTFAVALLSTDYLQRQHVRVEEYYILLLLGTLGAMILAASRHFASFFLGLETLSVSLYALIGYLRTGRRGNEAAMKYLIIAGATSATLLFGMALIYARTGALTLAGAAAALADPAAGGLFVSVGTAMILVGIGFKLALVPMHWWTPDVYEGAPAPVTAYVATVSKGAVFALLIRYLVGLDVQHTPIYTVFYVLAAASMIGGNLLALLQVSVKRVLAYSSIAHLGYAMVAFVAGGTLGAEVVTFYLVSYFIATVIAFGIMGVMSTGEEEADMIEHYRGLLRRHWALAAVFTASLLSLASIPLTAGFVAKFFVAGAAAHAELWPLLIILAITSTIGLFYYLRVIAAMIAEPDTEASPIPRVHVIPVVVLSAMLILLFWFGIVPEFWQSLIRHSVGRSI